ncbi:fibronectin type III domain-containing protein [Candidatus Poriferisodalis sp.]|uniref:fibronectin type III domain-containing protein n=1 Tax=Candidatus Poriferisodalis sp. TaxID=3101277 RepID=UPI003AF55A64
MLVGAFAGLVSPASAQTLNDAAIPGAPAIESLTVGNEALTVAWTAPASNGGSDITSYDLRYIRSDADDKTDGNWTVENGVWTTGAGALESTLSGLANGTRYDVSARAVNTIGNGAWSATVTATPATVPTAPNLGFASAGSGRITITWSGPASDGGSYITSYDLRYIRSDGSDGDVTDYDNWEWETGFARTAGQYRIGGLTNGVAYHVEVRAVNAAGDGAWSQRQTRTPVGPPRIPSIDTVTPGDGSLAITWSAPSSNGGSDITGYNLRYVNDAAVCENCLYLWSQEPGIWTSGGGDLEFTLSGLTNGVRYRLGLQAVNGEGASGWSDWSDPRTGIAGSTPAAPGAPTIDRATSDGANVHVRWSAPSNDGGADITGYDLRYIRSDGSDGDITVDANWTPVDDLTGDLNHTVEGLTDGVEYDFQVRADNSAGAGSWSETVNNADPEPPGATGLKDVSEETPNQLRVSWRPPADDGGAPPTHYDLRYIRSDGSDGDITVDANWTQVDDLTGDLEYTITGLTSGVNYRVQVRAANRGGDGPWSLVVTLQPKHERPNPPGNISATPSNGTLTVKWTPAPAKAGVTVAGYKVSYIRLDDPDWNDFSEWTTSGLIASDTLEYAITGLQNGVRYSVDVYSVSSADRTSPPPETVPAHSPGRAPAAVGSLKRIRTYESSIFIQWTGPTDNGGHTVTSYDIHHYPTSDPTAVVKHSQDAQEILGGPAQTNVRSVGNLIPHVEYKIQVRARNRIGAGPWSSLTLIPRRQPVELTINSVTEGDGTLTVAWTDGGDDEITGYELRYTHFRFVSSVAPASSDWQYIRDITGTSPLEYTIDGLVNGRWYQVQVRGRNKYGQLLSDWSTWSARPNDDLTPWGVDALWGTPKTVPAAPAVSSVTPGDKELTVAWSAPDDDGGSLVTSYNLRYIPSDAPGKDDDDNWEKRTGIWSSGARLYDLFGLTNGVRYDVQVRAVNDVGGGPWSRTDTGTAQTEPGMPFIGAVTPGDRALSITWSAPVDTGGFDITSYNLRYIPSDAPDKDDDDNWEEKIGIWSSDTLEYTLDSLTNGVEYEVEVRAVTFAGAGPWSGTLFGTPRTTSSAPTINSVIPGDRALTVAWSAPDDTGGSLITSYNLRYIPSNAPGNTDWTVKSSVWSFGALVHTLDSLTSGVSYDVQVQAVNAAGDGRWSDTVVGTLQTIPKAPTINSVIPDNQALTVAWSAPSDNGGSAVTSYDLGYIRSNALNKDDDNWEEKIGIWSSDTLEYTLDSLTNGVRYDVRLRAVNAVDEGSWSAAASATPQTAPGAPAIDRFTSGDRALAVSWFAPDDDGGSPVTSYNLRYIRSYEPDPYKDDDNNWTPKPSVWHSGTLEYTLDSLANGIQYDVQVQAVNAAGGGRWSDTVVGTPRTRPTGPAIDSVTHGDKTLTINWSEPDDIGGSAVASYDVRYIRSYKPDPCKDDDDNWTKRTGIWSSGTLEYTLRSLTNGIQYDVQVRAVNDVGGGPWSRTDTGTAQTEPGMPSIGAVTPDGRALSITWTAPDDTGGFDITSYDLRHIPSAATNASWTEKIGIWIPGDLLQYRMSEVTGFTDLMNSVKYDVQVRAVSAVGAGPWSVSRTGTPVSSGGSSRNPGGGGGSSGGGSSGGGSSGGGGGDFDVGVATFVVANGWSPADVGAASVLAARTSGAVVLYTAGDELSEETRVLLREALPAEVVIVGGTAAVTRDVRTQIDAASPESGISRITGEGRSDTAAATARRILGAPSTAGRVTLVVANGWSPPDIGAATALAARSGRSAVLYTQRDQLPDATAALLRDYDVARVILIGGTAAISSQVHDAIAAAAGGDASISRLTGDDRIDTAAQTARRVLGNPAAAPDGITLVIANGWSPPDVGVAAALAAATENSAVAYTEQGTLPDATAALIRDYRPTQILIVGGRAAITDDVRTAITTAAPDTANIRRVTGSTRTDTAARAARRILANP